MSHPERKGWDEEDCRSEVGRGRIGHSILCAVHQYVRQLALCLGGLRIERQCMLNWRPDGLSGSDFSIGLGVTV